MVPTTFWYCCVNVCPTQDHVSFGQYSGAFVNNYALARDADDFRALVLDALTEDHFQAIDWEDGPTLLETGNLGPDEEFSEEAHSVLANLSLEWPVQYGNFHSYPKEGLDA